jgi:hypothetical protein
MEQHETGIKGENPEFADDLFLPPTDQEQDAEDAAEGDEEATREEVLAEEASLLGDLVPDELALYRRHFLDYSPKAGYHVKRGYDRGFVQQKNKKTGKPAYLFPAARDSALERHLDFWRYANHYQVHDPEAYDKYVRNDDQIYWLGLYGGKRTSWEVIDLDNKAPGESKKDSVVGWHGYEEYVSENSLGIWHFERTPKLPVMLITPGFLATVKTVYDAFPGRLWAISSETLGVYAWQRYKRPQVTDRLRQYRLGQLRRLGLDEVEVFPDRSRCFRLPFGRDYRTITAEGVVTDWEEQLRFFDQWRDVTPPFSAIVTALRDAVVTQWRNWQHRGAGQLAIPLDALVTQLREAIASVGLGQKTVKTVVPSAPRPDHKTAPTIAIKPKFPKASAYDFDHLRHGRWPIALEKLAQEGLPRRGSVGPLCEELATWLYWVELYGLPEAERKARIEKVLWQFIIAKHNGTISRMGTAGGRRQVEAQVARAVTQAIRLDPPHRAESLELFARIRQKRQSGAYRRLIVVEPLLAAPAGKATVGEETAAVDANPSSLSRILGMCIKFGNLPQPMEAAIKAVAGRKKVLDFARRLLHLLHNNNGSLNLGRKELTELLGYKNPKQIQAYRQVLIDAGLLKLGTAYSVGAFAKRHSLTKMAKTIFEVAKGKEKTG